MAFQTGASGNPKGRPKGTGSRQQIFNILIEPHRDALINTAINLALDGNEAMLRLLLDRMLPAKPTDEPIQIDMTDALDFSNIRAVTQLGLESLKAVMSGKITPEEAGRISTLLGVHHKTFETTELLEGGESPRGAVKFGMLKKKNPGFITYLLDKERSSPGTVCIL